jgi:hypothetical protein
MPAFLFLLLSKLPAIISVASEITAVVNGVKSADSIYSAIKGANPDIAEIIAKLGAIFPNLPGLSFAEHLESIAKALFGLGAWPVHIQDWLKANADEAMRLQPGMGNATSPNDY